MVRRAFLALGVLGLLFTLGGCGTTQSVPTTRYGVSWTVATSQGSSPAASRMTKEAIPAGVNDSAAASGYWITDPAFPYGQVPRFYAWQQDASGTRNPAKASWSLSAAAIGSLPYTQSVAETWLVPTGPGTARVTADVQGTLCVVDVTVYPGFILQTASGVVGAQGKVGYVFSTGTPTSDTTAADIYIQADGDVRIYSGYTIHIPGGYVVVPQKYLHEAQIPDMTAAPTSWKWNSSSSALLVLRTRAGKHVAMLVTSSAYRYDFAAQGYAQVAGYRILD